MSDSSASSTPKPAKTPVRPGSRRVSPVVIWMLVLVVAAVAFGAVVVTSGGIGGVMQLLGLGSAPVTKTTPPSRPVASVVPTASVAATAAAGALPAAAQARMYAEQLQSQPSINELLEKKIASIKIGAPSASGVTASIPLTVEYVRGSSYSGTMALRKYGKMWYFFSMTAASSTGGGSAPAPTAFDSAVVDVITGQQATVANQDVLVNGVMGGGYKTIKVVKVSKGAGTATVNVLLSGGTATPTNGRFVCISKTDGSTPYWFIARFDAQ